MTRTIVPPRFIALAKPVRVDLAYPIEVPGGEVAAVWVRPLFEKMGKLANVDLEGEVTALADSMRLPPEMVLSMDDADYERVRDALREATARYVRGGGSIPRPVLVKDEAE